MGNIKLTKILGLLCCLVGGSNAYAQTNHWIAEEWTTGTYTLSLLRPDVQKPEESYYLLKPEDGGKDGAFGINAFLKYESEATTDPKLATKFTFSNEAVDWDPEFLNVKRRYWYKISCYDGTRQVYVYAHNGNGKWGDDNTNQWCVESTNTEKKQYILWQNDPGDFLDPRLMSIQKDNGGNLNVSYMERKAGQPNPSSNDWVFISEAQYNALYPGPMIKEALGYHKIWSEGWYYPQGYNEKLYRMKNYNENRVYFNNIDSYKTASGTWLARTYAEPDETKSHGARLAVQIHGLVPEYSYDITAYAHVSRPAAQYYPEGTAWPLTNVIKNGVETAAQATPAHITAKGSNEQTYDVEGTYGEQCTNPTLVTFTGIKPDANGTIIVYITTESTGTNYVYGAIKGIKHSTDFESKTLENGTYYIYNPATDKYLEGGLKWGTQAVVGHGLDFNVSSVTANTYKIQSRVFNGNAYDNYLNGTYIDGKNADGTLYISGDGKGNFNITTNSNSSRNNYLAPNENTFEVTNAYSLGDSKAIWNFITPEQRKHELHRATVDNPKDATFLITSPNFGRNDTRPITAWTGGNYVDGITKEGTSAENATTANYHLKIAPASFDISQTLTDIPNGLYLLSAQGFHNDPNNLKPIVELYANDIVSSFDNLTGGNQKTEAAAVSNEFANEGHKTSLLVIVTNGTLKIGARSYAKDGNTRLDNFELTYYGRYDIDDMDVTSLFIKNPHFQGNSSGSNWSASWTLNGYGQNLGNNNQNADKGNTYQGFGYFPENDYKSGGNKVDKIQNQYIKGAVSQKVYLPAGAYKLSALCVAQNNPGFLFVKEGDFVTDNLNKNTFDIGQHITFVDNAPDATWREVSPKTRELIFVHPTSGYVTLGYCHQETNKDATKKWNAVDNFRLDYLGYVSGTDVSCQIVNRGLDADNEGLNTSNFGWIAETGSTGFTYGNNCGERFYSQTGDHLFNTFQTVKGLPDGWYEVGVQGFYRDGWGQAATENRKNVFLYANKTYEHIGMIDGDDRFTPDTEKYGTNDGGYPNSMAGAQTAFTAGYYPNKVIARVTDGNLKIGVSKEEYVDWDWAIFDNFSIKYLYSDANIYSDVDNSNEIEFTQFIKNPSFEASHATGWSGSKTSTVKDNKAKDLMINGDERYLADAGSLSRLGYYYFKQTISGNENGLPQGTYALKAKLTSVAENDIAVFVNGRLGSFIMDGTDEGREITLGNIGVNNNEEFEISFTSNYGFKLDNVRLIRSSREGEGDALFVDLDGLIAQAKAILESGFVGDGAFQINGDALQAAYNAAVLVNENETAPYSEKKTAKDNLVNAIKNIQVATPKKPDAGTNYMIRHMASGYYLATDGVDVIIKNEPSTIQFHDEDNNSKYQLYDENNGANKYIYKHDTSEGAILSADPEQKTEISFRIIFINGIPSHIALTYSGFEDGTCLGTESTNYNSKVFCTTDATDGYSRWIISVFDPTIKTGDKMYLYNLEAGAFIEDNKAFTPAVDQLDGVVAVITDASGTNTLAVSHDDHPGVGEQDVFSTRLASVTADKYIYAKFTKVTDSGESGNNLYTIQMQDADGNNYVMWGRDGYLNFQTPGNNVVFALGLNNRYGEDGKNCALWRVTYESGNGYVIQNVGNGGFYNPNTAEPSAEPVYLVLENKLAPTTIGNNAIQWNVVADDEKYKLNTSLNKYMNVSNTTVGIHSYITREDKDNEFVFLPAGNGYDYNIYTISMDPNNATFGSATYGGTYVGWSGESNYSPLLPLISADDAEPRGIHWMKCSREEYNTYKVPVAKAHDARMSVWPIIRSAIRNGVDMTEFNRTYNNPMALPGEITNAAIALKELVINKVLHATPDNPMDVSYDVIDAECQSTTLAEGGWTGSGYERHDNKPLFENIGGKQKMILGGYSYKSATGNPASMSKQITGLAPGKYALALDVNATTTGGAVNGLKLYISSNALNEVRADVSGLTATTSTVVTPIIDVAEGEDVRIGFEIEGTNNVTSVAFDNFKLRYYDTYRDHTVTESNNQKTINFTGTWRDTEEDEIKDIITTEGKGVTIDMEDAKILDPIDITLTTPDNVLVYVPAGADVTINGEDKNVIKDGDCTEFYVTDLVTLNIYKQFKAHKIYYSRKLTSTSNGVTTSWSYASLVLPYRLHTNSDVQVYRLVEGDGNGRFYIERISDNEAGVPALMRKKNPEATTIEINEVSVEGIDVVTTTEIPSVLSTDGKLKLIGSYIYDTVIGNKNYKTDDPNMVGKWANNYYYFKNDKFVRGKDYFYCDAFRTYIDVTQAPSQVRSRTEFELSELEETNGIDSNESDTYIEVDEVYNTNGIQKQGISKGINIVKMSNGQIKKIFVK